MINAHFFEESDHAMLRSERVDVAVEDLEEVGNDDGLEGGIEGVYGFFGIGKEGGKFVSDFLMSPVLVKLGIEGQVAIQLVGQ